MRSFGALAAAPAGQLTHPAQIALEYRESPPKNADCAAIFMLPLVRYIPVAMPTYRDPFTVNESIGDWRDFRNSSAAPAIPGVDPSGCLASWTKWL
jgi:hypothetical protein